MVEEENELGRFNVDEEENYAGDLFTDIEEEDDTGDLFTGSDGKSGYSVGGSKGMKVVTLDQ